MVAKPAVKINPMINTIYVMTSKRSEWKPIHCTTNTRIREEIPASVAPFVTLSSSSCSSALSPVMRTRTFALSCITLFAISCAAACAASTGNISSKCTIGLATISRRFASSLSLLLARSDCQDNA